MRVTIAMIAEAAGVSRATVDRVINKRGKVKPEVEKRIQGVIDEFGYKPNKMASALSFNRNIKRIAVIYKDDGSWFNKMVESGIAAGKDDVYGYGIEVDTYYCKTGDSAEAIKLMDQVVSTGYDGIALRVWSDAEVVAKVNEICDSGIPVVTFNSDVAGSKRLCFIGQNLYKSGETAGALMMRLLKPGKTIALFLSDPRHEASVTRCKGFISVLEKYGIPKDRYRIFPTMNDYHVTYESLERAYREMPDLGGIYMSTRSNTACGDFMSDHTFREKPVVICHDVNETNKRHLKNGDFDCLINQDIPGQSQTAIVRLKDIIRFDEMPPEIQILPDLSVVTAECI